MGLIKAGIGALGGTLADQWKEFFYCESIPNEVLMMKGRKKVSGRSSNTRGNDNVISDGSGIAVADGQAMIIVENGKIVEFCAEPGEFTYRTTLEPSIFTGKLGESLKATFQEIGKRFAHGGEAAKDQRIYYFNTKEIIDNKFGTRNPIPFRAVDRNIGLDIDVAVRCSGVYSYRISDPMRFYANIAGNISGEYTRDELDGQLKAEFIGALQPAFGRLSGLELRPSQIPAHSEELKAALNDSLSSDWGDRGLCVEKVAIGSITLPEEDQEMIKQLQSSAVMRDPSMAAAKLVGAQAQAMQDAAKNANGAMMGFMGMGIAQQAGGSNAQDLFAMGQQRVQQQEDAWRCGCGIVNDGKFCHNCGAKRPEPVAADAWKCPGCGKTVSGKFCPECGTKKPEAQSWTCGCGTINDGKFCRNCGARKPDGAPKYRCSRCGWEPKEPSSIPKFCPECGNSFDNNGRA